MKKLVIVFLLGILILSGLFIVLRTRYSKTSFTPHSPTPSELSPTTTTFPENLTPISGWKTFSDPSRKASFQYPPVLGTAFLFPQVWPPKITVSTGVFSCKQAGQVAGQPIIIQKSMGGNTYCIQNSSEGAAGTIYTSYTYSFVKDGKLVQLEFTIGYPQCENYPEPKLSACQKERQTFDLDALIDKIAKTVTFESGSQTREKPVITTPASNAKITSPLMVSGTVPSGWMFEGAFPIRLLDSNRNVIVQGQAKEITPGSWTSGKPVEFTATLDFSTTATSGFILLEKDNPSGMPQNAGSFEIPVQF